MQALKSWHWREDMEFNDIFCFVMSLVARKILANRVGVRVRVRVSFWCFRKFEEKLGNFFLKKLGEEDRWKFWCNASVCCFKIGFRFDVSKKLGKIWGNLSIVCYDIFFSLFFFKHLYFSFITSIVYYNFDFSRFHLDLCLFWQKMFLDIHSRDIFFFLFSQRPKF